MSTGRTIALIKALGGSSGGGGGGSEEQFVKVYENTLTESMYDIDILPTDFGGIYVDAVVYIAVANGVSGVTDVQGLFYQQDTRLTFSTFPFSNGKQPVALSFGMMSVDGLMAVANGYLASDFSAGGESYFGMPPAFAGGPYPTESITGADKFMLSANGGSFPVGTTITVYARKKVA